MTANLDIALADHLRQAARILDLYDASLSAHADAVTTYAVLTARELGLSGREIAAIHTGATLHDVGKLAVDNDLLNKPGPLDPDEWQVVQHHAEVGHRLVDGLPLPTEALHAVRHHHERFDGQGYPDGLAGEDIPLAARIVAVADAFDAMVTDRPYRRRLTPEHARAEIARCAGSHFCPRVVAAFLNAAPRTRVLVAA